MRLILNILWFALGGWISGTAWILAGVILAVTIVGLPWTPAAFRIAGFSYWPFGKMVVDRPEGPASLQLMADADHAFHVPAKTGRKDPEVLAEALAAAAAWMAAR